MLTPASQPVSQPASQSASLPHVDVPTSPQRQPGGTPSTRFINKKTTKNKRTKLPDLRHARCPFTGQTLQKRRRPRLGDDPQVRPEIGLVHSDTCITDTQDPRIQIGVDRDLIRRTACLRGVLE